MPDVFGGETTLTLLFQNLISNAIKFRGDRKPLVQISSQQEGELQWMISLSDNGIGIKIEYLERGFTPFNVYTPSENMKDRELAWQPAGKALNSTGAK